MNEKEVKENFLNKYLIGEEEVLWEGKPNSKPPIAIFLFIFFSLLFFLFVDKVESNGEHFLIYFFVAILGLIYTCIRLGNKKSIWENTIYVVTTKKILVIVGGECVIEKSINDITCVRIEEKKHGIGTIVFGNISIPSLFSSKSSRNEHALKYSFDKDIPIFNDINDVREIYILVNSLRNTC